MGISIIPTGGRGGTTEQWIGQLPMHGWSHVEMQQFLLLLPLRAMLHSQSDYKIIYPERFKGIIMINWSIKDRQGALQSAGKVGIFKTIIPFHWRIAPLATIRYLSNVFWLPLVTAINSSSFKATNTHKLSPQADRGGCAGTKVHRNPFRSKVKL